MIFSCALAFSALLAPSCSKEEVTTVVAEVPVLTLAPSFEVNSQGGTCTVTYSVDNPADDGTVTCRGDASWVSGFDTSTPGSISFTVTENTEESLRTSSITVTYSFANGSSSDFSVAKIAVIQYGTGGASLLIDPTAITAGYEGGTFSFGYKVDNVTYSGELTCETDADWIGDFDYSSFGTVSFDVDENDLKEFRTATVTVTYAYGNRDRITKELTVMQDHPDIFGRGDANEIIGTYIASASVYGQGFNSEETEWVLRIFKYSGSLGYDVMIEGILPWTADHYASTGEHDYFTGGFYRYGQIMIPSQCSTTTVVSATVGGVASDYYLGFTPCTMCVDGEYYYNSDFPDCIFYGDASTGVWASGYGMFASACEIAGQIESLYTSFQAAAPGITITRISSDPECEVSSATSAANRSETISVSDDEFRHINLINQQK